MNAHTDIDFSRVVWSGSRFIDVLNPAPEDFILTEIATGLARETRFGGSSTRIPWNVAQHSLFTVHLAEQDGVDQRLTLATLLMHDSPEYMLRDMLSPVKAHCPDYKGIESAWWQGVAMRFNLPLRLPPVIKHYDWLAFSSEKAAFVDPAAGDWPGTVEPREVPENLIFLNETNTINLFLKTAARLLVK